MRKWLLIGSTGLALALGACSENSETAEYATTDMATEAAADMTADEGAVSSDLGTMPDIPASVPKIAYVYDFGFAIAGDELASLQQTHADLCEQQGPYQCRILSMTQSGEPGDYRSGELALAVAAPKARSFGKALVDAASSKGGEQTNGAISGEDLSKAIVDTEARLQSRIILRDRLLEVLRTRNGPVRDLVEAERSVAQVNEEIDQARSWLAEMKGRVSFSRVNIAYESASPAAGSMFEPAAKAVGALRDTFSGLLAVVIYLLGVGVPLALLIIAMRRWWVRHGRAVWPRDEAPVG